MPFVEFDQSSIYYASIGEGEPILFIHPPGLGHYVFQFQSVLSSRYQLLLPDLSGHGQSTSVINYNISIVDQYVEEIHQLIQAEGLDRVILCAYSAGGMIAQSFCIKYPDKVKGLIVSGGYPKVDTIGLEFMYEIGETLVLQNKNRLAQILAYSNSNSHKSYHRLYTHMLQANIQHWLKFYYDTHHLNLVPSIKQIQCPALFVYGEKADWINEHRRFYEQQANINIVFVHHAFHRVPSKHYYAFNHLITHFINRL
ncbi:AB hydrolase superfamily protein YvaM [Paraliobacillus ryukyuensis]|uniref:Pimeloyl-ACP methyl ester carboxylesterase n=1 Tax=Paraliobacillus ryukyuensis TaxID=200904 RepID=A0A366EJD5_9BACI|nr:alpha/beta hydrolase [Paraliobacillus ryukyuensis]RBP01599.1 pimeloyl-ACP methyl ester carboxylesterase [Paraliobacillus ryukyuensis]